MEEVLRLRGAIGVAAEAEEGGRLVLIFLGFKDPSEVLEGGFGICAEEVGTRRVAVVVLAREVADVDRTRALTLGAVDGGAED